MIEVDCPCPEGLGDVGDAIFAQDIECEAAGTGHDAGVVTDAACVLTASDIADPMVPVLDAPMLADDGGPDGGGVARGGGEVDGDLAALVPEACGGG